MVPPAGLAVCWGLKEPSFAASPLLPALNQALPQERPLLEQMVGECHTAYGNEISFYWCFPFWVMAAQLQPQGIVVAGLRDFEVAGRIPQLIVLVDLPVQRSELKGLMSRYPGVPLVLLVAETPLERQTQHFSANLQCFAAVLSYNHLLRSRCSKLEIYNLEKRQELASVRFGLRDCMRMVMQKLNAVFIVSCGLAPLTPTKEGILLSVQ